MAYLPADRQFRKEKKRFRLKKDGGLHIWNQRHPRFLLP